MRKLPVFIRDLSCFQNDEIEKSEMHYLRGGDGSGNGEDENPLPPPPPPGPGG